ncbi:MAG: 50S ribosomal protein L11 methyltransferase [Acidobacteriota bacterium]
MTGRALVLRSHDPIPDAVGDSLRALGMTALWEVCPTQWRAYFPDAAPDPVKALREHHPDIECGWEEEPAVDWAGRYQSSLRPLAIGRRFAVLPSPALANPWPQRIPLRLVPGMAFGTGEHYTTASCLRLLEEMLSLPASVLDVGCGSGILAAASCKLGCPRVTACDVDADALLVAGETAAANGVSYRLVEGSADQVEGEFDLVFANILAETLAAILPHLVARLAPGGLLAGSGIASGRQRQVLDSASSLGLALIESRTDGEWWTLLWRAPLSRRG